ncbi:type II secretion system protein [Verrucomicrobiaceae bacterium N1E253]|uniref:Type II secretion system protein n=1 Tax=Oceaniferula marina TaxID=2748318 RepID=A0A851GSB3_9BACT|nr:type II secretion system protein [Oceaniferula marina]NWK57670.1 type II secretion system protein [Oceaniferula marina]
MNITRKNINKGFTLVELLVVIAIIAALAGFATPLVLKQMKKADMATATHNAKQLHLALFEFDQDYGFFPDSADSAGLGASGNTANDVLRQLFLNGNVTSEENFYAKTAFSKQPDGDVGNESNDYNNALDNGEVGFLYIDDQSTGGNSSRPLLAAPLMSSGGAPTAMLFDKDIYGGKMMVLRIDGSVKQYRVDKTSNQARTTVNNSQVDIFATQNPVWDDTAPQPLYPSKKGK